MSDSDATVWRAENTRSTFRAYWSQRDDRQIRSMLRRLIPFIRSMDDYYKAVMRDGHHE